MSTDFGDSGCPVCDSTGKLVAVHKQRSITDTIAQQLNIGDIPGADLNRYMNTPVAIGSKN
jgi:hypothetical protein